MPLDLYMYLKILKHQHNTCVSNADKSGDVTAAKYAAILYVDSTHKQLIQTITIGNKLGSKNNVLKHSIEMLKSLGPFSL